MTPDGPAPPQASAGPPLSAPSGAPAGAPVPAAPTTVALPGPVAPPSPTPIYVSKPVRNALVLAAVAAAVATAWAAPSALGALLVGTILAVLLNIPVQFFERYTPALPRGLAVLVSVVLLGLLLAAVIFLVIPALLADLEAAIQAAPDDVGVLEQKVRQGVVAPLAAGGRLPAEADAALSLVFQSLLSSVQGGARSALASLTGLLSGFVSAGFVALSVFVIALYLVGDAPRLRAGFVAATPRRYRADAQELWDTLGRALTRMLVASLVSNTVQGALAYIGLSLIGVPLAGLLAAVMWVTAFIPIAGAWLGGVPAFLVALTVSPEAALKTALLYLTINFVDGNVLTPRLQGQALTVHPVVILVAILAAGQLFGLVGILVMLPLLAIGRVLVGFLLRRLRLAHPTNPRANRQRAVAPPAATAGANARRRRRRAARGQAPVEGENPAARVA